MTRPLLALLLLSATLCQAHTRHITISATAMTADTAIEQYDTLLITSAIAADLISYNTPYGTAGLHTTVAPDKPALYIPTVIGQYSFKATPPGSKALQLTISATRPIAPPGVMGSYPYLYWTVDTVAQVWHLVHNDTTTTKFAVHENSGKILLPFQPLLRIMDISIAGWTGNDYELVLVFKGGIYRTSLRLRSVSPPAKRK